MPLDGVPATSIYIRIKSYFFITTLTLILKALKKNRLPFSCCSSPATGKVLTPPCASYTCMCIYGIKKKNQKTFHISTAVLFKKLSNLNFDTGCESCDFVFLSLYLLFLNLLYQFQNIVNCVTVISYRSKIAIARRFLVNCSD